MKKATARQEERQEVERVFLEGEVIRESAKAWFMAIPVITPKGDRRMKAWFPKSRSELGSIPGPAGERKGIITELWLADRKVEEFGDYIHDSVTLFWTDPDSGMKGISNA